MGFHCPKYGAAEGVQFLLDSCSVGFFEPDLGPLGLSPVKKDPPSEILSDCKCSLLLLKGWTERRTHHFRAWNQTDRSLKVIFLINVQRHYLWQPLTKIRPVGMQTYLNKLYIFRAIVVWFSAVWKLPALHVDKSTHWLLQSMCFSLHLREVFSIARLRWWLQHTWFTIFKSVPAFSKNNKIKYTCTKRKCKCVGTFFFLNHFQSKRPSFTLKISVKTRDKKCLQIFQRWWQYENVSLSGMLMWRWMDKEWQQTSVPNIHVQGKKIC